MFTRRQFLAQSVWALAAGVVLADDREHLPDGSASKDMITPEAERDRRNHDVLVNGSLQRPDAGPFLASFVEDDLDQRLACFGIDFSKNLRSDLDQITLELAFVPLCKSLCELRRIHCRDVLQN